MRCCSCRLVNSTSIIADKLGCGNIVKALPTSSPRAQRQLPGLPITRSPLSLALQMQTCFARLHDNGTMVIRSPDLCAGVLPALKRSGMRMAVAAPRASLHNHMSRPYPVNKRLGRRSVGFMMSSHDNMMITQASAYELVLWCRADVPRQKQ